MTAAPTIHPNTTAEAWALSDAMHRETETDTLNRARWRVNVTFSAFYDDEPTEPDQAIRDAFTDLFHEAEARGVDIWDALNRARDMYSQERAEWAARETEGEADQ